MSQPTPSTTPEQPEAVVEAPAVDEETAEVEVDVPLNRAARRARAKGHDPAHVGPQSGRTDQGRGPRSHTKRQIG